MAPMLAAATPAVEDEETEDEDVLIDFEVLKSEMSHFRHRFVQMLMRILGCTSLKRLLEAACVKALDVKTAGRLVKDPVKSALRKAARCGRATAAGKMLKTASYAQCLTYAANLIVAEAGLLWKYFFDHDATTTTESPAGRRQRRTVYLSKASSVAVGYGAAYISSTIGIVIGTYIKPGFGTVLGAALGDIFSIVLLEDSGAGGPGTTTTSRR